MNSKSNSTGAAESCCAQCSRATFDLSAVRETRSVEVNDADGIGHGSVESGHVRPLSSIFGTVSVTRVASGIVTDRR